MSLVGLVSRVLPVQMALRNCTRDEGGPFEFGNQVLISSHRKLLSSIEAPRERAFPFRQCASAYHTDPVVLAPVEITARERAGALV
jgi:hypothetical protein